MRPRCCLRYLTFFGINMVRYLLPALVRPMVGPTRGPIPVLFIAAGPGNQALTLVEPHLHADLAVGRARFGKAVVDVGAQRLQRQLPVQIPLRSRDFGAVEAAGDAHLDAARAETQR